MLENPESLENVAALKAAEGTLIFLPHYGTYYFLNELLSFVQAKLQGSEQFQTVFQVSKLFRNPKNLKASVDR